MIFAADVGVILTVMTRTRVAALIEGSELNAGWSSIKGWTKKARMARKHKLKVAIHRLTLI